MTDTTLDTFDLVTDLGIDSSIFPEKLSMEARVLFTRLADDVTGWIRQDIIVDIDSTTGRSVRKALHELQRTGLMTIGDRPMQYRQAHNGHRIVFLSVILTEDGRKLRGSVLEQY